MCLQPIAALIVYVKPGFMVAPNPFGYVALRFKAIIPGSRFKRGDARRLHLEISQHYFTIAIRRVTVAHGFDRAVEA